MAKKIILGRADKKRSLKWKRNTLKVEKQVV